MNFDTLPRCLLCGQTVRLDQALWTYTRTAMQAFHALHAICGALDSADAGFAEPLLSR